MRKVLETMMSPVQVGFLFMAGLFAYSASVQLDDVDWYFWLPFYSSASLISFAHAFAKPRYPLWALLNLFFGLLLFIKVVLEAAAMGLILSMDMNERVVREKLGSFLVITAMALQLQAMLNGKAVMVHALGIWVFVISSLGLCAAYALRQHLFKGVVYTAAIV